jgi:hypothetical protein
MAADTADANLLRVGRTAGKRITGGLLRRELGERGIVVRCLSS